MKKKRIVMGLLFLFKFNYLFRLHWVFLAVGRLSLVAVCRLLTAVASVIVEHRL